MIFGIGFEMQKPEDIEGECPFLDSEEPCPYGLACRFLGTHKSKDKDGVLGGKKKMSDECNGLNKDVQKLLWKNKMKFPKADAKLKALGLLVTMLRFYFSTYNAFMYSYFYLAYYFH